MIDRGFIEDVTLGVESPLVTEAMADHAHFEQYSYHKLNLFNLYHEERPWLFQRFQEVVEQAEKEGREHFSANFIFEMLRWNEYTLPSKDTDQYKINSKYVPIYARALVYYSTPHLDDFFTFKRPVKTKQHIEYEFLNR